MMGNTHGLKNEINPARKAIPMFNEDSGAIDCRLSLMRISEAICKFAILLS